MENQELLTSNGSPSKKRIAERQLRKEQKEEEEVEEPNETKGTWTRADEEVISKRRIVKVRRPGNDGSSKLNSSESSSNQAQQETVIKPKENSQEQRTVENSSKSENESESLPISSSNQTSPSEAKISPFEFSFKPSASSAAFTFNSIASSMKSPFSFPFSQPSEQKPLFSFNFSPSGNSSQTNDNNNKNDQSDNSHKEEESENNPEEECTPIDFKPLLPEKPVETGEEGEETLLMVGDFVHFLEQKRTSIHSHVDIYMRMLGFFCYLDGVYCPLISFQLKNVRFLHFDKVAAKWKPCGSGELKVNIRKESPSKQSCPQETSNEATDESGANSNRSGRVLFRMEGTRRLLCNIAIVERTEVKRRAEKLVQVVGINGIDKDASDQKESIQVGIFAFTISNVDDAQKLVEKIEEVKKAVSKVLPSSDSKKEIPQESKSSPKAIRNVNSGNGTTTDNALNEVETATIS